MDKNRRQGMVVLPTALRDTEQPFVLSTAVKKHEKLLALRRPAALMAAKQQLDRQEQL